MKPALLMLVVLTVALWTTGCGRGDDAQPTPQQLEKLARCLTQKGWVMYGTSTCSGCRAQRKAFGDAWPHIAYVECDPHEPGSQVDRCLNNNIRTTPTWIQEVDGQEINRLERYQLLEDLARFADCDFPPG